MRFREWSLPLSGNHRKVSAENRRDNLPTNRLTDKPTVRPTNVSPPHKKKEKIREKKRSLTPSMEGLHISELDWLGNFRLGRDRKTFVLALTRELGSKFGSRRTSLSLWNNHSMGLPTCPLQHSSPLTISTSVCSCVSNTFFFVSWLLFCFFFVSFFLSFFLSFFHFSFFFLPLPPSPSLLFSFCTPLVIHTMSLTIVGYVHKQTVRTMHA